MVATDETPLVEDDTIEGDDHGCEQDSPQLASDNDHSNRSLLQRVRSYRPLVPFIVFMALLLDAVLTTCVVPIVPDILHKNDSDISIGFLLGSKSFFQLISNAAVGPITDKFGFNVPMVTGFVLLTSSTIFFAFAPDIGRGSLWGTYSALFIARSVEGVGCSCVTTAGMAMVADRYPDQQERGAILGKVLGGIGLGVLLGYPFGGAFSAVPGGIEEGWKYPFLIISAIVFFDLILQLVVLGSSLSNVAKEKNPASMLRLVQDPYVIVGLTLLFVSQLAVSIIEPIMPAWMKSHFSNPKPKAWQIGLVMVAITAGYIIVTPIVGRTKPCYRWIATLFGMLLMTFGTVVLPLAEFLDDGNLYFSILPLGLIGTGIGMTDSTLFPTMGMIVDLRHSSVYGSIFALADMAVCIGFFIGPVVSSLVDQLFGFSAAVWSMSGLCLVVTPFVWFLKSPKAKREIDGKSTDVELQSLSCDIFNEDVACE